MNKKKLKILFAGESPGSSANYLLAFLRVFLKAQVQYVPSRQKIASHNLGRHDIFVFSDYLACDISPSAQRQIQTQVQMGSGLMMIGGWGSFTGFNGNWQGSVLESLLPVRCLGKDDRLNFASGAVVSRGLELKNKRLIEQLRNPPIICGMNRISLTQSARVLLQAWPLVLKSGVGGVKTSLQKEALPLLVCDKNPHKRVLCLMTDVAPHWCGGWVDWGQSPRRLQLDAKNQVEVGQDYLEFLQILFLYLAGQSDL